MRTDLKKYRDYLYTTRAHPAEEKPEEFVDQRDSFHVVYFSLFPFLVAEYLIERSVQSIPAGVVFPVGFLLFWAFYYTFYQPGLLEERLSLNEKFEFAAIPSIAIGFVLWFIKITIVELVQLLFLQWFISKPQPRVRTAGAQAQFQQRPQWQEQRARPRRPKAPPRPPPPQGPPPLPQEVQEALRVLRIPNCRNWSAIQKRYRQLAKKYHPDLAGDITDVGRRFMEIDAAYRTLIAVRKQHFN